MRLPVSAIILLFIAAALFSENLAAAAQPANPYPWCAIYHKEGGERHAATLTPVTSAWHQSRASAAFAYRIYNIALG
jgi:hypothetical protein